MPRIDSNVTTLVFAAMVAVFIGAFVHFAPGNQPGHTADRSTAATAVKTPKEGGAAASAIETGTTKPATTAAATTAAAAGAGKSTEPDTAGPGWTAASPGRIETRSGEYRLMSAQPGRIERVLVEASDKVTAGDPIVLLEDRDYRAKITAAENEVSVRRRERDAEPVTNRLVTDRRAAEDAFAAAELAVHRAQMDFDEAMLRPRAQRPAADEISRLRSAIDTARTKRDEEADKLKKALTVAGLPLASRLESSLALARAELRLAENALDRTRVRSPIDGTVLQLHARLGELAAPSADLPPIAIIGDMTGLRVRAEVDERDTARIAVGQVVVVRSTAYTDRTFEGRVQRIAQTIAAPRITNRGPRRPSDVEVLEVLIDLDGQPPLLPGMRVDALREIRDRDRSDAGSIRRLKTESAGGVPPTGRFDIRASPVRCCRPLSWKRER